MAKRNVLKMFLLYLIYTLLIMDAISHVKLFKELPFTKTRERVITKGVLNLQNRTDLLTIEDIPANEWMTIDFTLQPSIYKLKKGDTLRVLLYTTDFEHTIRDNSNYILTVDLDKSTLEIPIENNVRL